MGLARAIRELRESRGLSIPQVARRIGIVESTFRRWEASGGTKSPRLPDLLKFLNVVDAKPAEKASLLSHHSDSAYRALLPSWSLPGSSGDLWRAIRLRQGLGVRQLAKLLGVSGATIVRWESGRDFPEAEQRERLLILLNASSSEREMLCRDSSEVRQAPLEEESLDELWISVQSLLTPILKGDPDFPADIPLLALLREVARRFPVEPHAQLLLAETLHLRGLFLFLRGRISDSVSYNMGARNLALPEKLPSIWYGASSLLARSVPAPRHREAVRFWTEGVTLAEKRGEEMVASMLLREMATHTAKFGDVSCGLDYAREAKVRALRSGLPVYIRDADTVLAATLLQAGKFSEAMRVMPEVPTSLEQEDHPIGAVSRFLHWTRLCGGCGDKHAASEHLAMAYAIMDRYHLPQMKPEAETAARLAGL